MDEEATPTLPPVPGVDLDEYKSTLIERFSNPGVRDTIPRLCAESSDRIPKWLVPVIRPRLEDGGDVRRVGGRGRELGALRVRDGRAGRADRGRRPPARPGLENARRAESDPDAFITDRDLFGDLAEHERFMEPYREALASLHERGARDTLSVLLA